MFKIEDLKVKGHTNQEAPQPNPSDTSLYPTLESGRYFLKILVQMTEMIMDLI